MKSLSQYWSQPLESDAQALRGEAAKNLLTLVVITLLMAALSAILQVVGDLLPGAGYMISPLATAPMVLTAALSLRLGLLCYAIAMLLLIRVQSAQVLLFMFTTGLLGLGIGAAIRLLKKRALVVPSGGLLVFVGTCSLARVLYLTGLASLDLSSSWVTVLLFTMAYSWLWTELSILGLRWLSKALVHSPQERTLESLDDPKH